MRWAVRAPECVTYVPCCSEKGHTPGSWAGRAVLGLGGGWAELGSYLAGYSFCLNSQLIFPVSPQELSVKPTVTLSKVSTSNYSFDS